MIPLPATFYERSATLVAPDLLGHELVRREEDGSFSGGVIVETEAYLANDDPACHAARGRTERNRSMWGPPGRAYVYFIYGMHYCFNAVCQPEGIAEAVLIRAIEPTLGLPHIRQRRPRITDRDLMNGPGKLCLALGIDRKSDGLQIDDFGSHIFIVSNPTREIVLEQTGPIKQSTRIGITKATELPLRFGLSKSAFLSRPA